MLEKNVPMGWGLRKAPNNGSLKAPSLVDRKVNLKEESSMLSYKIRTEHNFLDPVKSHQFFLK